jgi:xanthine dehydrogenase small subunit
MTSEARPTATPERKLRFVRRGRVVELDGVDPSRTLLDYLRSPLPDGAAATGTKEGCAEGDCGACTVVLGELDDGAIRYRAVNACIRLLSSIDGCALWTVEDLQGPDGTLHPVQQALVDSHASQCGFCTPGFAMSMFALYQAGAGHGPGPVRGAPVDRAQAQEALSGNLCRCTGYRPILDAAQRMHAYPSAPVDEAALVAQLTGIAADPSARLAGLRGETFRPAGLDALLALRARHPEAQLVAGCTDVGLWITKRHMRFAKVIDLTGVREIAAIHPTDGQLWIGAAVRLTDAFAAMVRQRPQLRSFAARFAGVPIRNSGTLGGNVANGSPIGDSMPVLIALGAKATLQSVRGTREVPIDALYTGYRKSVIAPDEVLTWIQVPDPTPDEWMRAYKVSKRFDDDISAVCLAVRLQLANGQVAQVRIGAGGVAAIPARGLAGEQALTGRTWSPEAARACGVALQSQFTPISDMRASAAYRSSVLANLMMRLWHESQGQTVNLEHVDLASLRG